MTIEMISGKCKHDKIQLVDELVSGVRNIYKYGKIYFGDEPEIIEEESEEGFIE